ncbi:MAG TPA: energy transducer TonB, partial [Pyrinomonadaceae bacterium]
EKAKQCAARGLEFIEIAASLAPDSSAAWSFKVNLLREMAKLAEMQGQSDMKEDYQRQASEARQRGAEASERSRSKLVAEGNRRRGFGDGTGLSQPPLITPSAEGRGSVMTGGVLNGKAISKPVPAYPPIARAANASGTVMVQVLVDESGNVISASAVSGHPLLQAAAVAAAREAKFSQTLLSGQPVKVRGLLTYEFKLE